MLQPLCFKKNFNIAKGLATLKAQINTKLINF